MHRHFEILGIYGLTIPCIIHHYGAVIEISILLSVFVIILLVLLVVITTNTSITI